VPRQKIYQGYEDRVALDREAKVRLMHLARALKHRTEKGKHYGRLTGKFCDVLHTLVWLIHDGKTGQCNPSYETIAAKAECCRATVASAIRALEDAGLLSWVNRFVRRRTREDGMWATRPVRTSNAYVLHPPKPKAPVTKSKIQSGPLEKIKTNLPITLESAWEYHREQQRRLGLPVYGAP
jgi:hypothetical protein